MVKKIIALAFVALMSANVSAAVPAETEQAKAIAEQVVALKALGLSDADVIKAITPDSNLDTTAAPATQKWSRNKIAIIAAVAAVAALAAGYGIYKWKYAETAEQKKAREEAEKAAKDAAEKAAKDAAEKAKANATPPAATTPPATTSTTNHTN